MMQLYRLSNTDLTNLKENVAELNDVVSNLEKILSSKTILRKVIKKELEEVLEVFDTPRKSKVEKGRLIANSYQSKKIYSEYENLWKQVQASKSIAS